MGDDGGRRPVGPRVLALAVAIATLCGGSAAEGGRTTAAAGTAPLPAAVCDLVSDLEPGDRALVPPSVYDLDARSIAAVLSEQRVILRDIAAQVTGEMRRRLEEQLEAQPAIDADMLDTWDVDRVDMASVQSDHFGRVWSDSVRLPDGRKVPVGRHLQRRAVGARAARRGVPGASAGRRSPWSRRRSARRRGASCSTARETASS